ncbi:helix-turn-helix domain-containing protein, partial [Nonomuraea sp. NPDC049709]|uniref:helix-turn-helix domain-containing protein n=1 Tax=Nonomuraea sp. NPDC049709 TaxID=3154736 RepID=UPI003438D782
PAAGGRGRDPEAVRDFERRFAGMMIQTGVPAMVARVLATLFTADAGSCTAAELAALLQVSPASISKAVGWLAARGLIRRERDGRRERYLVDDHIWYRTWQASIQSMTMWRDFSQEGAELLGDNSPAGARLRTTSQVFQVLAHDMAESAEHWRRTLR